MIIFDLDGTLRDPAHRLHHVTGGAANWDAFYLACGKDAPIRHMLENLLHFHQLGHTIEIWSGCSDIARQITLDWLARHGVRVRGEDAQPEVSLSYFGTNSVAVVEALIMRSHGDFNGDVELKEAWLHRRGLLGTKEPVEMVFDDRKKVVDMWRRNGIPTIQVAAGDF